MATLKGIDVSRWQEAIDWPAVAASGVQFAILRAGYGKHISQKDPRFEENYTAARAAGIPVGAYWYSYATTVAEARQEAEVCLQVLNGRPLDWPVWFDQEYEPGILALTKAKRTALVRAFCDAVEAGGYRCGLYASADWLENKLNRENLRGLEIWCAQYGPRCTCTLDWGIWQYTSRGRVAGIRGNVDLNEAVKDYALPAAPAGVTLRSFTVGPMSPGDAAALRQWAADLELPCREVSA